MKKINEFIKDALNPSTKSLVKVGHNLYNIKEVAGVLEKYKELKKKYDDLLSDSIEYDEQIRWLDALEAAGVDAWEGFDYAREIFNREDTSS